MLAPNQTRMIENSKTLVLLEKVSKKPETFRESLSIPEILLFAENYDDPKLPQNPFVFKSSVPLKIYSKKEMTMVIPLFSLSPTFLLWFMLVKDCDTLMEKFDLLRKYCNPDVVVLKTERCQVDELSEEFGKPIQRDFIEPDGSFLKGDFRDIVFRDGVLYIIR